MASAKLSASARRDKRSLTIQKIDKAELRTTRYEIPDAALPGFYLSVMPSGHRSFVFRYRIGGQTRKLTLGSYPQMTLAQAHRLAREAVGEIARGNDPAAEKAAQRRAVAPSAAPQTMDDLVEKFLTRHVSKECRPSTAASYERVLRKDVLAAWSGRTLASISQADVCDLIESVAEDRPVMANRALAVLGSMFNWAIAPGRRYMAASPADGVKPSKEKARDRVLTDAELKLVLDASDQLSRTQRDFVRLLALTLQRRNEVAHAKWEEFDLEAGVWVLPAARAKNNREHRIPLSAAALTLLRARKQDETGPYVFGGARRFNNFARLKQSLDRLITEANGGPIKEWRFHDLRRSGASAMPALGVSLPVTERVLNHVSGSFKGIVQVYQRYDYAKEMAEAMQKWADHLAKLSGDNVVEFPSNRKAAS
jgi:integrase